MRALSVLVATIVASLGTSVSACTCGEIFTAELEYARSDAVFTGRVVGVEQPEDEFRLVVRLALLDCWKGDLDSDVVVRTAPNDAVCGVDFQLGADYLVYARSAQDELRTDLCTRTGLLSNTWAQNDIEIFGNPGGCHVGTRSVAWTVIKALFAN